MNIEKIVRAHIALRDHITALEKAHKEEVKGFKDKMKTLENKLMAVADETGQQSMATGAGTAFKTTKDSVRVGNKAEFFEFVVAEVMEHGVDALYYLTGAPSKNIIKEYMDNHEDELPPGITYDSWYEIQTRKPTKGKAK